MLLGTVYWRYVKGCCVALLRVEVHIQRSISILWQKCVYSYCLCFYPCLQRRLDYLFITSAFQMKSGWFKLAAPKVLLDTDQSLLCPPRTAGTAECFPAACWIYLCQKWGEGEAKWYVLHFQTHLQVKWLLRLDHLNLYWKSQWAPQSPEHTHMPHP